MPGLCPQCLLSLALKESPEARAANPTSDSFEPHVLDRLSAGRILGERYQIRELLGRGGMGEVFRAFDLKLRVDVALKAVRPEKVESERARELLRREVRAAREVVSPNVCRIFDLVTEDGQELVSMEFIDGTTLAETLWARGPIALEEAREIASQFLSGLEAIHQAGLVHRDFKPENVMLTRAGRVVVMDFGLAKLAAEGRSGTIAGTPAYMPPEQTRGDALDARADVFAAGLVLAEMLSIGGADHAETRQQLWRAVREAPPRLPEGPWAAVLRRALSTHPEERPASARELQRAIEEVTQRLPGFETRQPYPGLKPFTEEDAEYFFGRELEVEALLKKLRRPRLLALVAPSGAGKSSFLRAGLVPALPKGWKALVATPGDRPFQALAQALAPAFAGDAQAMQSLLRFEEPEAVLGLFRQFRNRHEHALLIVDQFEELFTLCPDRVQHAFAALVSRLVLEADLHVLLSLRDDFLFACHQQKALAPCTSDLTILETLDESTLSRVLVQPALACGYRFEDDALVEEIIREVQRERGALPLLAFAASRLWERRDRDAGLLTRAAYQEIGGVAGALAQHAEATLERIGAHRTKIVRELFRNLVTAQGTRAVREREELLSVFVPAADGGLAHPGRRLDSRAEAEGVLGALVGARLLTSYEQSGDAGQSRQQVEIVHESLLEAWPRLVRWRTQDVDGAQLRDQLRQAARLWNDKGRRDELLWSGSAFEEFRLWRERYPGSLTATEADYAGAMAHRARKRKRLARYAITAALVILSAVVVAIGSSRRQALIALDRAEASRLLALAELRLADDPTEAIALATASLQRADSEAGRLFALKTLSEVPAAIEVSAHVPSVIAPAFSPDGEWLAAAGTTADVLVWPSAGGDPLVLSGHERGGNVAHWASTRLLVTGMTENYGSQVHLWSVPDGRRIRTIEFGARSYWQVGSRHLLAETPAAVDAIGGGLLRSWILPDGEPSVLGRDTPTHGAQGTLFAPDGNSWFYANDREVHARPLPAGTARDRLVTRVGARLADWSAWTGPDRLVLVDKSGQIQIWTLGGRPVLERSLMKPDAVSFAHPEPSGRWLSSRPAADGQIRLWDVTLTREARPLRLRRNQPWTAARTSFHPSGDWIASSTEQGRRLTLWPLRRRYPSVVDGYRSAARPAAFSADGRWLATSWADSRLRLWPLTERGLGEARTLASGPLPVWRSLAFDPKGRYVFAVGAPQRAAWLFPLDGSPIRKLDCPVGDSELSAAAVSPSGRHVATAYWYSVAKGSPRLCTWDVETGEQRHHDLPQGEQSGERRRRTEFDWGVTQMAFVDEDTLLTGGDGGLRRWNLTTGSHELVASSAPGYQLQASFSADRRFALTTERRLAQFADCREARLHDLARATSRSVTEFGACGTWRGQARLDASGAIAVVGSGDGTVRVGKLDSKPHLLLGHRGVVNSVAMSPDLGWAATAGEDSTLRLWPLPDLAKAPLHALPHRELTAKLRSLTNIRVVEDAAAGEGVRLELGPFPGWRTLPEW